MYSEWQGQDGSVSSSCPFHWCVIQVDVSYFPQSYPLQKALKSALITEETLCTMRRVFVPVIVVHRKFNRTWCISLSV